MEYRHFTKPKHDLIIPNAILCARNLSINEKMILSEIIWFCDFEERKNKHNTLLHDCDNFESFPSNYYFEKVFGISKNTVSKIIKSLNDKGYIRIKQNKGDWRYISYNKKLCLSQ